MIGELLSEKSKAIYFEYFRINENKFRLNRYLIGILFFGLMAITSLLLDNYLLLLVTPAAFYVGYKVPYINLISQKKQSDLMISFAFPQFLQSFMALLPTSGNVYQTFKNTLEYTSEPIKGQLEKLINNIEDENKREYYLEFAEFIGTTDAYMVMDQIYQFSEYGIKKNSLGELQRYIQSIQENKMDELIIKKMARMENHGLVPLFISMFLVGGFALIIVYYYIVDVMGSLNNLF